MLRSALTVRFLSVILLTALSLLTDVVGYAGEVPENATAKLRQYLRVDSSQEPGRERALGLLRDQLHAEGLPTRWIVSPQGVPSLVSRLEAPSGSDESVVLLHHADVVAPGEGWLHPPYEAEVQDGVVHGRGALDAKSLGIAHLEAFLAASRNRGSLVRDLIFLVVTDEEEGGAEGSNWLLETHPEIFAGVVAVLGEGGINRVYGDQLAWWGIEIAQKRPLWLRVETTGRPGHGSTLNLHTAPHRLIRALDRLLEKPLEFRVTPEVRLYLESIAPYESRGIKRIAERLDEIMALPHPESKMLPGIPNYFLDSIQINMLQAGEQPNSAPESASAWIDIRLLPDTDEQQFLRDVRDRLGDDVSVTILLDAPPVDPSPVNGVGFACVAEALSDEAPVVPAFIPGITDSRFFRQRGIPAYGFSPFKLGGGSLKGIHGIDEQIPVAVFDAGISTMIEVVQSCTSGGEEWLP